MAKTRYLSEAEKREGRKHLYRQEMYNGIAYSWIGDTIVYLMAIYFSASNIALGYISAAAYITGVVLPFVPRIFHGKNHIKVQSTVWAFRGLVCLLYLGLFFLTGQAAVFLLLLVYTLFNLFRMVGVALHDSPVLYVQVSSLKILQIPRLERLDIWISKLSEDRTTTLVKLYVQFNGSLLLFV